MSISRRSLVLGSLCSLLLAHSPGALSGTMGVTGLEFAGGCPYGAPPICMPGGNPTPQNVADVLGVPLDDVDDLGLSALETNGTGTAFSINGFGATSGTWSVSETRITHLAFKSSTYFILGELTASSGHWDNTALDAVDPDDGDVWYLPRATCPGAICGSARDYLVSDFKDGGGSFAALSNVRAFSVAGFSPPLEVVPLPGAAILFVPGALAAGMIARRNAGRSRSS